jgi:hypothetical protein
MHRLGRDEARRIAIRAHLLDAAGCMTRRRSSTG